MKKPTLYFLLILLGGIILRLYSLGKESFWGDEAIIVWLSNLPFSRMVSFLIYADNKPLLYYFYIFAWGKWLIPLLGYFISSPEALWRSANLIFALGLIWGEWFFGKKLLAGREGEKLALLAAFLLSISAVVISKDQELRNYPLFSLALLLSFLGAIFFRQKPQKTAFLVYLISTLIALYTHYLAFLSLLVQNLVFILLNKGRNLKSWFFLQALVLILYLPGFYFLRLQSKFALLPATAFNPQGSVYQFFDLFFLLSGGINLTVSPVLFYLLTLFFLALFIYGCYSLPEEYRVWLLSFSFLPLILALIISRVFDLHILTTRHGLYIFPAFYLGIARGILELLRRSSVLKFLGFGGFLIFIFLNFTSGYLRASNPRYQNPNWRGAAAFMASQPQTSNANLIISSYYQHYPLDFYFKGGIPHYYLNLSPEGRELLSGGKEPALGELLYPPGRGEKINFAGRVGEIAKKRPYLFLVLNQEFLEDPQDNLRKWLDQNYRRLDGVLLPNFAPEHNIRIYLYATQKGENLLK